MKPVSLKTQEIIKYIPGINTFILGIWLYNSIVMKIPNQTVWKSYPIIFGTAIPLGIILIILADLFPAAAAILGLIFNYLTGLLLSHGLIRFQKKLSVIP